MTTRERERVDDTQAPSRDHVHADGSGSPREAAPGARRGRPAPRVQRRGPVGELLQRAVDEAARLLEADGAMVYLVDAETDTLRFAFDAGIREVRNRRWVRRLELRMGQGMFGVAAAERRVVHTDDYLADQTFRHSRAADRFVQEVGLRSMVTAPMVADGRVFGALGTFARRPGAFGDAQVGLVRALADHAAQAMANALLIEELGRARAEQERRADRERTLREIATAISALHDQADVIQRTVDESARLLGADGARIDLIDPKLGLLRWAYQSGADRPSDDIWPEDPDERLEHGVSGKAVVEGRVVLTGDYLDDDQFIHRPGPDGYIASVGLRSVMAAPLIGDRGPFGALTIYSTTKDAWGADDAQLLEALATEAAIAIRNARLIEELGRSRSALARRAEAEQALREIAGRITAIRDPSELLQLVVDAAARLVRADGGILDLIDPDRSVLMWSFDTGVGELFSDEEREELWIPIGVGATGVAVAEDRTFIEGDDPRAQFPQSEVNDLFFDRTGFRSMIIAPISADTGPLGAIEVYARRERAFDEADGALIRSLADQAAIAIQNARLIEQLARSREETARRADAERTLREITASISAIREPDTVLQQTINEAKRLLRGDAGIIDLLDQDHGVLRWAYDTGNFEPADRERFATSELQVGKGIAGRAVLERRVIRSGDYRADEHDHSPTADAFAADRGIRSVIVAPIVGESGPVGAIEVYSHRPNAFDDLDAAVLGGLAAQAAVTIQNARLIEALDRSAEEIRRRADAERALRQIAANISAIRNADVILQQTVDEAKRLLDSTDARIDLLEEGRRLRWRYTSELSDIKVLEEMDAAFEIGEGVAGVVVAEGRPFRTGNYLEDERFPHTEASDNFVRAAGLRSALAVPLTGEAGVLGAISVATPRPDAYDDGDVELLTALADQAAIAIQNARLIEELQRSRAELAQRADTERSLREMAARIAELRDPDELLRRIVDETRRLLGSDGAHLTRMREEGDVLVPVVVAGGLDEQTERWLMGLEFPLMGGINGLAAGLGEPIWTADYASDRRIPHEGNDDDVAERLGLRSMASVPLRSPEGGIIGTLAVSYHAPHEFGDEELDLLKGLADHAAIALTNTSLYERLRESERRYRHLVQNSPDLVWSIDAEGRLSFISDTSERLTGWKPEELLGKHFGALVHPSSHDVAEIDWTKGMTAPQQEIRGRVNLLHRDGHAIPAEFTAMGALDEEGRFAGANGSVRDMTERDRLERELRESEERYRFLVEKSPDIIWSTDASGVITYISRSVERALALDPAELLGRRLASLLPPGRWDGLMSHWEALLREPDREQVLRVEMVHRDGRPIPFEMSVVGRADDGRLVGLQGVAREVSVRERLERELRESEARFRGLVQTTPDTIWRADASGHFTFAADSAETLFGWPVREIVGRHFEFLTAPESMPIAEEQWRDLAEHPDVVHHVPLTLLRRDGSRFAGEVTMIGLTEDGRFAGGGGTVRDVSERERLERELRESEERYRFLVENSPDIVFSTDADGRLTYVSETIERGLGYQAADLIGRPFGEIAVGEPGAPRGKRWAEMAKDPTREMVFPYTLVHRDGRRIPFEVSVRGLVRNGAFAGVYGAARDVSERERLERELRSSERRYRFLVENSPDVVFSTDDQGRFTFMSETIERMTGFTAEELQGQHFSVVVEPDSLQEAQKRFNRLVEDPSTPQIVELNLRRKTGELVPTEVSSIGMVDEAGRFSGITGSTRDVRDRIRLERDLRRQAAEIASGEERAHLARELHDSVTQALFSMTLLARTIEMLMDREPARAKEQLAALRELQREALAEMRALIFELRPGNLQQDGLYKALRTHTAALQGRIGLPIVVKSELEGRLPVAIEEVLYRIAQEALHNVVKHAGAREVRLELARDGSDVCLRISDDGKGFDPASVPDGHLGLAGMRARAHKIGARLEVRSQPGAGTTVEVGVPGEAIAEAEQVAADLRRMEAVASAE